MTGNEDGSHNCVAKRNEVPAFEGPFSLTMRIYWPEPDALNPLYVPPAIEKAR